MCMKGLVKALQGQYQLATAMKMSHCAVRISAEGRTCACSMTKLFDLMVTGVKMGIVVSTELDAPLSLAYAHLRGVCALVAKYSAPDGTGASALPLIDRYQERLSDAYADASPGLWLSVRSTLLSFFEDQRVRVRVALFDALA